MNTLAKLAIAAAAVVVVAVVGYNFLPARGGVGGRPRCLGVAFAVTDTAAKSVAGDDGRVSPDRPAFRWHAYRRPRWRSAFVHRSRIRMDELARRLDRQGRNSATRRLGIDFWPSAPDNVYADPCAHTPQSPPPSATAAGLAAAVAAVPGTDLVSGPSSIDVGGRPAQHVVLTIREDLGCKPHDAYLWYDESTGGAKGGWRWAEGLGATYRVWIIDVDGTLVWIDGLYVPGAGPELGQEIEQIIDSIQFE